MFALVDGCIIQFELLLTLYLTILLPGWAQLRMVLSRGCNLCGLHLKLRGEINATQQQNALLNQQLASHVPHPPPSTATSYFHISRSILHNRRHLLQKCLSNLNHQHQRFNRKCPLPLPNSTRNTDEMVLNYVPMSKRI